MGETVAKDVDGAWRALAMMGSGGIGCEVVIIALLKEIWHTKKRWKWKGDVEMRCGVT